MRERPRSTPPERHGRVVWLGPSPDGVYDLWGEPRRAWIYVTSGAGSAIAVSPGRPHNTLHPLGDQSGLSTWSRAQLVLEPEEARALAQVGWRRRTARRVEP